MSVVFDPVLLRVDSVFRSEAGFIGEGELVWKDFEGAGDGETVVFSGKELDEELLYYSQKLPSRI